VHNAQTSFIAHGFVLRRCTSSDDNSWSRCFPGKAWIKATPEESGWSTTRLEEARKYFDTLPPANLVVVDHGRVVVEWGDPAMKIMVSSVRKSLLSVLYGINQPSSKLDWDTTIGQLGIDDDPPLTAEEKKATVRMLLESRSGVYHSSVGNTPTMLLNKPERGAHVPGTFFYYNNWDFNALGTIFEQQFHTAIGREFRDKIAVPTQMEDFRLEDMYYKHAAPDDPAFAKSLHPAYPFRLSARDLARFGYLILRDGNWNGTRIVPSSWIAESTHAYTENARDGAGYGYLWWINGFDLPEKNFYALGALGKFLIVIPDRDLVVVLLNHTEFPPNGATMSVEEYSKLPTVTVPQMGQLLKILLDAQPASKSADPKIDTSILR
jgi:CubicO group peptidase (beta-lactamase class C family)